VADRCNLAVEEERTVRHNCRITLLDVCQATQRDLERYFTQSGSCFGDLRRARLMAQRAAEDSLRMSAHAALQTRPVRGEASEDAFIERYLARLEREERYSDDWEPRFSGGSSVETFLAWECRIRSAKANNAKQHSLRVRPRRTTIRRNVQLLEPAQRSSLVDLLDELLDF